MNTGNVLQKFWALSLVVLLAGFIGIGQANAQSTYFVDAVAGNDAFNGGQMAVGGFPAGPFQTITQAITTATDGDTIVILANDYTGNGVLTVAENLTLAVRTAGANSVVNVDGFTIATAAKTLVLADEAGGGAGVFVTNSDGDELTLTAGTVNVTGALTLASGASVRRTNGALTGTAPTVAGAGNLDVTYTGVLSGSTTAGNELPASLGALGTLAINHTGALLTIPNSVTVNDVVKAAAGNVTFSQNLTTLGGAATDIDVDAAGTFTVSGTATIAGGIDVDAAATFNWGATSIAGAAMDNNGGALTFASFNATDQNVTNTAGTTTVTGDLRLGVTASATRVTVTAGSMVVGSLTADPLVNTAGNEADVVYTINNDATFTVNGAITEGALAVTNGVLGETETGFEYSVFTIDNANGQEFTIGASSTISGDISNAERDGGADGDGIILANSAVLTVLADRDAAAANLTSIGDIVGGTLVLNYANAGDDAVTRTGNVASITKVNNLTFGNGATGHTAAKNGDAVADATLSTLTVSGDLRLQRAATNWQVGFTVGGILYVEANTIRIDARGDDGGGAGDALVNTSGLQGTWGGLSVGASTGFAVGVNNADALEDVTISGTTADPGSGVFAGKFSAASAAVTTKGGFESDEFIAASHTAASGTTTVGQANGAYDVAGAVVVASGATLSVTSAVATDDAASLDINGTFLYTSTGTLTVSGDIDIDASTGAMTTAAAANFVLGGNFTGGTYTDTGVNDSWTVNAPNAGSTFTVKPGTQIDNITFNGSGRTVTIGETITVDNGVTLGNDVTVALGDYSIILSNGNLTLNDEAAVTNNGTNGSLQFTGTAAQSISVAGVPTVDPTLQNIVVNNSTAGAAPHVDIDSAIKISGTLTVLNGIVRADGVAVTFTGDNAKIAYSPESGDAIATNGAGSWAGTRDVEYIGTLTADRNAGAEFTATNIRNLTVSATGNFDVDLPATVATITGNLTVSNSGADLSIAEALTVNGNASILGDVDVAAGKNLTIGGALTVSDGDALVGVGAMEVRLTGNSQTHTIQGVLGANTTLRIQGTGTTVNGYVATAGDADGDAELNAILVDAGKDATFNTMQVVNGAVTVNGTATINMVTDGSVAGGAADADDGQILGAIDVNNGGSLTVSTTSTTATLASTTAVDDGGSFTAGSNLTAAGAITVGNTTQAAAATFDLNGKTVTTVGAAPAVTVNASTAAASPSFGASGTLNLAAAGTIVGAANPTIPNLTINGGAGTQIDSDVTVTGTFTVAAASDGANGDNVTLSGANAIGQFNADFTGTAGPAGSQVIASGTVAIRSTGSPTITNLNVAGATTFANSATPAATSTFTVAYLNHDSGVLDITDEVFTLVGDGGVGDDWDYDGGSYAGTGTFVMTGAGPNEIDLSTNGATISVPNLTVNGNAAQGLQLAIAGDGIIVTGTLTLNGAAGNVETEAGANDASFAVANGATIVRSTAGAGDHFDNAPTLGTGLTVRYTNNAADVTTANELPSTLARLEWENTAGDNLFLEDGVALTVDQLEMAGNISIDENDDGDNSITISDGGRIEYDGALASFTDQGAAADSEAPSFAGSAELRFLAGFGATATTDLTWPDALAPTVVVGSTGANVDVQMHESRSVSALTVGDGNAANTSQVTLGATTMTVSGTTAIAADGTVTGGTLDANGTVTNSGSLASAVLASQSITLTGNLTTLTLDGTTAQTLTVPAAGASLTTLVVNNAAGVTVAGGNVAVGTQTVAGGASGAVTGGLTLTAGGLNMGANTLLLAHAGSGIQGYTRTNGCVYGNIRKQLSNTTNTAPADRLEFPLCSAGGTYRPYAITFNNPNVIGGAAPTNGSPTASVAPAITVKHDVSGENGVSALSGTNGLPQTVNGVAVARYPISPSFFWTVSPSFTMSPSLTYDVDMRANDYSDFSASCGDAACDINEIYPIRRHVGSSSNLWSVASATTDNFLAGDNDPVVIGRSATGALQTSGTVFTFGLKSIFAAAAGSQSYATTTGNSHIVDLSTLFSGAAGSVTYSAVASDATGVTNPTTADVAGNNLTITGGADAGSATVTVNATDAFGATASATFSVTNSAALAATADDLDRAMNVGGTSTVAFADVFSGGAGTVTYGAASSDASVTVAVADGVVTMTGASAGSATVTLTATDASSTAVSATKAIAVTVNAGVSVANAVADMSIVQGQTATVDASTVFANGTGAIAVTVSGGTAVVGATIDGTTVTVSGLKAYDGDPLADSAPVTITLTGTDTLGGTTTDSFDVTVTPVLGDLDGSGAPSAASASLALDAALGLVNLTANQLAAVDYNGDSNVTAYDAALIFAAAANAKVDFVANPAAELVFGDLSFEGNIISIPVQVSGDVNDVISASFATHIDPALATIVGVTSELADGWMVRSVVAEDGTINLAVAGLGTIDSEGIIATINVQLTGSNVQFNLDAEGAVNNNATMALDAVEVAELPETFALHGNYPNPFNPTTSIAFDLPESADVEIQVIDMIGRQVMTLPATQIAAGVNRTVQIDAARLASGTYFYRVIAKMESKTLVETGRMMLVK